MVKSILDDPALALESNCDSLIRKVSRVGAGLGDW